jgi:hypothetical protein
VNRAELEAFVDAEYGGFRRPEIACSLIELGGFVNGGVDLTPQLVRHTVERNRRWYLTNQREIGEKKAKPAVVYYMRLGNRVKIGWSSNLAVRVATIQPEEVMATEDGGQKLEARRHKEFADLRVSGEWFRLEEPLIAHIEALQRRAEDHAA